MKSRIRESNSNTQIPRGREWSDWVDSIEKEFNNWKSGEPKFNTGGGVLITSGEYDGYFGKIVTKTVDYYNGKGAYKYKVWLLNYPDKSPISSFDNIDSIWVSGYDMEHVKLPSPFIKDKDKRY